MSSLVTCLYLMHKFILLAVYVLEALKLHMYTFGPQSSCCVFRRQLLALPSTTAYSIRYCCPRVSSRPRGMTACEFCLDSNYRTLGKQILTAVGQLAHKPSASTLCSSHFLWLGTSLFLGRWISWIHIKLPDPCVWLQFHIKNPFSFEKVDSKSCTFKLVTLLV